jgi:hypothetical protein
VFEYLQVDLFLLYLTSLSLVTKTHLVDPSTILQRNEASQHRNKSFVRLGFAIISFFLYLYMCVPSTASLMF